MCVNQNGYVCLGEIPACSGDTRPLQQDVLVGLNYYLDTSRIEGGNIYFQSLSVATSYERLSISFLS